MKCVLIVVIVIASVYANNVGRSGWGGSQSSGWGSLPQINIDLSAGLSALGQGSAVASQALLELASGDANAPASIISNSGINAEVDQGGNIQQVALANAALGTSSTINDADVQQSVVAVDGLEAQLSGANLAHVENSAATDAQGSGDIEDAAVTINHVQNPGWNQN